MANWTGRQRPPNQPASRTLSCGSPTQELSSAPPVFVCRSRSVSVAAAALEYTQLQPIVCSYNNTRYKFSAATTKSTFFKAIKSSRGGKKKSDFSATIFIGLLPDLLFMWFTRSGRYLKRDPFQESERAILKEFRCGWLQCMWIDLHHLQWTKEEEDGGTEDLRGKVIKVKIKLNKISKESTQQVPASAPPLCVY